MEKTTGAKNLEHGHFSLARFLHIVGLGIFFVLSYVFETPSTVFALDNGDNKRGTSKSLIGGVVVHIEKTCRRPYQTSSKPHSAGFQQPPRVPETYGEPRHRSRGQGF